MATASYTWQELSPHECSSSSKQGIEKAEIFQSAITDFNQVLKINPSFLEAYCNRGQARAELKDYKVPSQTLPRRCGCS